MRRFLVSATLALVLSFVAACIAAVEVGELREESETLELLGAESVSVGIDMGVGKLNMSGGSKRLLDAEFKYNVDKWKPVVDYDVHGGEGRLRIEQPSAGPRRVTRAAKCEWDLKLNEDIPMVVNVDFGAGASKLYLGDLSVTEASIDMGAGDVLVDFSGSKTLKTLEVAVGAGHSTVDLSGQWANDLTAHIGGGVGECTLIVPGETGVRVTASKGIGKINVTGLRSDGDHLVNDAYGETDATIVVDVETGIGNINIRVEETGI